MGTVRRCGVGLGRNDIFPLSCNILPLKFSRFIEFTSSSCNFRRQQKFSLHSRFPTGTRLTSQFEWEMIFSMNYELKYVVSTDREDKCQATGIPKIYRICRKSTKTLQGMLLESMWWFLLQISDPVETLDTIDRLAFGVYTCKGWRQTT